MPSENDYIAEMIRSVEIMSRQLVEFRQDIGRAVYPMYPRIVEIEKQLEAEARERPARQQALDQKLAQQDQILDRIFKRQLWGRVVEALLIVGGLALVYWMLR